MKSTALPATIRLAATASLCAAALLLHGCASGPASPVYLGAADAQKRLEAENGVKPTDNFDSRANYLKVVEQMQQSEMWFASLAHIDALEQRWGVTPESIRLRADGLRNSGQPAESQAFYQRLKGTPLESAGLHGQGLLAGARGEYPVAVQFLEQARRMRPADPVLLGDLGYAHLRSGTLAEARVPLMQAFQLKPDSRQAQVNLALYLEATGDLPRATSLMDQQRMPPATRIAIRQAARELNPSLPPIAAAGVPTRVAVSAPAAEAAPTHAVATSTATTSTAAAAAATPATDTLALKISPWTELSRTQSAATTPVLSAASQTTEPAPR